ncbi:hypothetical protein NQ314_016057 [Rhamnusium bicolor]|uniref:Uncharacterized protein n=1 Tax=Rhamnusium bicolor TaxID=1586634 RepID=A0AAV8WXA8_9CUCU|nr:hypothetical protein NQ314_016057 [Rhamnusium bicolor]
MSKNKVQEMKEKGLISEAVLDFLKEKRSPETQQAKQKKKMLSVLPGQSVSYLDMKPRDEDESEVGPSAPSKLINTDLSDVSDEEAFNNTEVEKSLDGAEADEDGHINCV